MTGDRSAAAAHVKLGFEKATILLNFDQISS